MNDIIKDVLSSSIALGIIAFVCKLILNHMDKRGIESYKSKLKFEGEIIAKNIEREHVLKKEQSTELGRWSLTLLSSVNGLIGRLEHLNKNQSLLSDEYYNVSTRYYLCQFLCWANLFRMDRDASVISPVNNEILIGDLLKNVSIVLRDNNFGFPLIRSLEQKYIGESLIVNDGCMTYKEFVDKGVLDDNDVLNKFIDALLDNSGNRGLYINELINKLTELRDHFRNILLLN
ncbi:hypothetical protein [Pectobacterium aquaticum]|uniref:Uncharacterized protein n=1 Tax=Pectobacterium aquaticum TaxID=2204145 RepID=A0A426J9E0_9GAMM|nr:hypothetical protein [Pectobacterium aquaticum]RRO09900.1 hypothetical protein DMB85_006850 [Pectobacterium aquaticum]